MPLLETLIERKLIDRRQAEQAERQARVAGGSLPDHLVSLGLVRREALERMLREPPPMPEEVEDTGLSRQFLENLALKCAHMTGLDTARALSDVMKLSPALVEVLLEEARRKRLLDALGRDDAGDLRYALTDRGRDWALDALRQSAYTGPAPVPLAAYQRQVAKQSIEFAGIRNEDLARCIEHLVLPDDIRSRLGPALNSGKSILLYGASGNGKTSVAEAIGAAFQLPIHLPHCLEVDGQVVKVYDPAVHRPWDVPESDNYWKTAVIDPRWVRCRRPVVVTGGELSMEMLDLSYDAAANYYEAPAHIKANGGIFVIDDFGRQRVSPCDLLNRWVLPLERRVDFLTLRTGKKLRIPFDQLVIFSTNLPPDELMDEAALRRVHYKFHLAPPGEADFERIFRRVCEVHKLEPSQAVLDYLLGTFYPGTGHPRSAYHPRFVVEHVLASARYADVEPQLDVETVRAALRNLIVGREPPLAV